MLNRRWVAIVAGLIFSLATSLCAQSSYDAALAAGMKAYSESKFGDAEKAFKQAIKALESTNPNDARIGVVLVNLATVKKAQGLDKEVEPLLKRGVTVFEAALGPEHPDLASALENLGLYYYDELLAKSGKTRSDFRLSYVALQTISSTSANNVGPLPGSGAGPTAAGTLARAHQNAEKNDPKVVLFQKSNDSLQRALTIREKSFGAESPQVVTTLKDLGELHIVTERHAEAETLLKRAVAIRETIGGAEDTEAAAVLNMLASVYRNKKDYADAEPLYQRALAIQEKILGPEHPDLVPTLQAYAVLLKETGHKDEAKKFESRAKAIRKKHPES